MKQSMKNEFIYKIKSIVWLNKISSDTLNISKGKYGDEIEVFKIKLNDKELNENVLKKIDESIPYHIIFVLEYEDKYKIYIGRER